MDDNQQPPVPGQSFQPDKPDQSQPPTPPQPTQPQPAAPVPQPQVESVPQAQPEQFAQPPQANMGYQTPVQQPQQPQYQQPQQPVYPQAVAQPKKAPIKLLLIVLGVLVGISLIAVVAVSFLGGGLSTSTYTDSSLNFSVDLPTDWEKDTISVTSVNLVRAEPTDAPEGDETSVSVSRSDLRGKSVDDWRGIVQTRIDNLNDPETQELFGYEVSGLTSSEFGTDTEPGFRIDYNQLNTESGISYTVTTFHVFDGTGFEVTGSGVYSAEYSQLGDEIINIVDSYTPKS